MNTERFGHWGRRSLLTLILLFVAIPITIFLCNRAGGRVYYLASVLIICYTMLPFFLVFEHRRPQARELVMLAVMSALAVAARGVFAMVPHFKPMTAILMITGIAFGPEAGFLVGAVSGFASNFLFGQGPWTPWQMFAYGMAGFLFGLLQRLQLLPKGRLSRALLGGVLVVVLIGPLLDTCALFTMSQAINREAAAAVYFSGLPVNLIHALATFLTLFFCATPLLQKLERLQRKYGMLEG
jgi:energy-coupling factor transport system substrate-specific component